MEKQPLEAAAVAAAQRCSGWDGLCIYICDFNVEHWDLSGQHSGMTTWSMCVAAGCDGGTASPVCWRAGSGASILIIRLSFCIRSASFVCTRIRRQCVFICWSASFSVHFGHSPYTLDSRVPYHICNPICYFDLYRAPL